jgi:iron complex transport system substrate-binding protein
MSVPVAHFNPPEPSLCQVGAESGTRDKERELLKGSVRAICATLVAALASVSVVACSSDGEKTGGGGDGSWVTTTTQTDFGEVVIDSEPQRIVTLMPSTADIVSSLGIDPMNVYRSDSANLPWLDGRFPDGVVVNNLTMDGSAVAKPEAIAALDPDLIIGNTNNIPDQDMFDSLEAIATTLPMPDQQSGNFDTSWRGKINFLAGALNRQDEAAEVVSQIEDEYAGLGDRYGLTGKTYSLILAMEDKYSAQPSHGVFRLLGMEPSNIQGDDSKTVRISKENSGDIDGDIVFLAGESSEKNIDERVRQRAKDVTLSTDRAEFTAVNNATPLALKYLAGQLDELFASSVES